MGKSAGVAKGTIRIRATDPKELLWTHKCFCCTWKLKFGDAVVDLFRRASFDGFNDCNFSAWVPPFSETGCGTLRVPLRLELGRIGWQWSEACDSRQFTSILPFGEFTYVDLERISDLSLESPIDHNRGTPTEKSITRSSRPDSNQVVSREEPQEEEDCQAVGQSTLSSSSNDFSAWHVRILGKSGEYQRHVRIKVTIPSTWSLAMVFEYARKAAFGNAIVPLKITKLRVPDVVFTAQVPAAYKTEKAIATSRVPRVVLLSLCATSLNEDLLFPLRNFTYYDNTESGGYSGVWEDGETDDEEW